MKSAINTPFNLVNPQAVAPRHDFLTGNLGVRRAKIQMHYRRWKGKGAASTLGSYEIESALVDLYSYLIQNSAGIECLAWEMRILCRPDPSILLSIRDCFDTWKISKTQSVSELNCLSKFCRFVMSVLSRFVF
ncbi:hypothetical protein A3K71_05725 [archaeon RBG_16_50_20]|nr:MAG: hypothetical protein A3K71_05725 [archaeon RBG_16_50_20]